MEQEYEILLIEDDEAMAKELEFLLKGWQFKVSMIRDFTQIIDETLQIKPQAILLDINLPYFDGFYWCKKLRKVTKVPIIFLSSRDSSMDVVMAMNEGGDDYIQKPFDSNVLIAKLQAILRRSYEIDNRESKIIKHNSMELHMEEMILSHQDKKLELTKNEFRILKLLLEHKGQVVSRNEIMKDLWNDEIYVNENTLTVNVNRLRGRLEGIGLCDVISTKKGIGYCIS